MPEHVGEEGIFGYLSLRKMSRDSSGVSVIEGIDLGRKFFFLKISHFAGV
jgi:hypothetical protein